VLRYDFSPHRVRFLDHLWRCALLLVAHFEFFLKIFLEKYQKFAKIGQSALEFPFMVVVHKRGVYGHLLINEKFMNDYHKRKENL